MFFPQFLMTSRMSVESCCFLVAVVGFFVERWFFAIWYFWHKHFPNLSPSPLILISLKIISWSVPKTIISPGTSTACEAVNETPNSTEQVEYSSRFGDLITGTPHYCHQRWNKSHLINQPQMQGDIVESMMFWEPGLLLWTSIIFSYAESERWTI